MRWVGMRWNQKKRDERRKQEMTRDERRGDEMRWDEIGCDMMWEEGYTFSHLRQEVYIYHRHQFHLVWHSLLRNLLNSPQNTFYHRQIKYLTPKIIRKKKKEKRKKKKEKRKKKSLYVVKFYNMLCVYFVILTCVSCNM